VIARASTGSNIFTQESSSNETAIINFGGCQVSQFKASSNLNVLDSEDSQLAHFLVVAGGGAGGFDGGAGGGGAGGMRTSFPSPTSVLRAQQLKLTPGPYTVTVGGGAAAGCSAPGLGTNSTFSIITSSGGGGGGTRGPMDRGGQPGGSGGGGGGSPGSANNDPGAGNAGGFIAVEGFNGGEGDSGPPFHTGAGGGGASAVGQNSQPNGTGGAGGAGRTISITNSCVAYGGGGGAGAGSGGSGNAGAGGTGGGGAGQPNSGSSVAGTVNTGGGGGGGKYTAPGGAASAGGSGIVVVRMPGSTCMSISPGPPVGTVSTLPAPAGGCKVAQFTATGTLTIS
jgi:hypothetical protein